MSEFDDRSTRRAALLAFAMLGATACGALGGCAGSRPPPILLQLAAWPASGTSPVKVDGARYQLMLPLRLPDQLERSELLVPQGEPGTPAAAALVAIDGFRWVEPLREAVPRVLREDLSELLGSGRVWSAPLPPGVAPERQWRVEITQFEVDASRRRVRLRATWTDADARGAAGAQAHQAQIDADAGDSSAPALAQAHRAALHELARRMVAAAR